MKKYLFFAASALALASCSSDDYLGGDPGNTQSGNAAINFGGTAGKTTRADQQHETDAQKLGNQFVVYGYKTTGSNPSTVYDYYTITYDGKINQAEGNTQGWGYVGGTRNMLSELKKDNDQTIKYWDYSASQYDFIAFSLGSEKDNQVNGEQEGKIGVSPVTIEGGPKYSISGSVANLAKCFIADRVTAKASLQDNEQNKKEHIVKYQDDVQFNFRSLATKVRLGLYETINGYSVKDVKFYTSDNTKAEDNHPFLYTSDNGKTIPTSDGKGTMNITFGSNEANATNFNQAIATWTAGEGTENSSNITFGDLTLRGKESQEKTGDKFLGRSIADNDVSATPYQTTLPGSTVGPLTLKVDYTLESIDGSGEEIKVTGATATIPAEYTQWKPNYAYTYIFKISEKTNGSTGGGEVGLYPISFDAVVTETEAGLQNTITIVDNNSITTYAKGEQNNEYKKGSNIYVSISGQTLAADNTALYTAKLADETKGNIPESLVALCLKGKTGDGPWKLDNNGNELTVTKANAPSIATQIDAADAADGNAIPGNFAKFTPDAAGNYVFEYTYKVTENETQVEKKAYKVIKVVE